ncbi:MAG: hypothetical protein N3D16_12760 [Anaerolineales bacterium]|nr:hypothetical protein [Anaerolineales bacterium]
MDVLAINFLLFLLCAFPLISFGLLIWVGYRRKTHILETASLEPLFLRQGFRKASIYQYLIEQTLYILTKQNYTVTLSLRDLPFEDPFDPSRNLLTFLVFTVQMPLRGRFLIRTPNLEEAENNLLDEPDWRPQPSEILRPFGLRVISAPQNLSELERRLQLPAVQSPLSDLTQSGQPFFIYAAIDHYVQLGFGLKQPTPEQVRRWIETTAQFVSAFYEPSLLSASKSQASLRWVWMATVFGVMVLFFLGFIIFLFAGAP